MSFIMFFFGFIMITYFVAASHRAAKRQENSAYAVDVYENQPYIGDRYDGKGPKVGDYMVPAIVPPLVEEEVRTPARNKRSRLSSQQQRYQDQEERDLRDNDLNKYALKYEQQGYDREDERYSYRNEGYEGS